VVARGIVLDRVGKPRILGRLLAAVVLALLAFSPAAATPQTFLQDLLNALGQQQQPAQPPAQQPYYQPPYQPPASQQLGLQCWRVPSGETLMVQNGNGAPPRPGAVPVNCVGGGAAPQPQSPPAQQYQPQYRPPPQQYVPPTPPPQPQYQQSAPQVQRPPQPQQSRPQAPGRGGFGALQDQVRQQQLRQQGGQPLQPLAPAQPPTSYAPSPAYGAPPANLAAAIDRRTDTDYLATLLRQERFGEFAAGAHGYFRAMYDIIYSSREYGRIADPITRGVFESRALQGVYTDVLWDQVADLMADALERQGVLRDGGGNGYLSRPVFLSAMATLKNAIKVDVAGQIEDQVVLIVGEYIGFSASKQSNIDNLISLGGRNLQILKSYPNMSQLVRDEMTSRQRTMDDLSRSSAFHRDMSGRSRIINLLIDIGDYEARGNAELSRRTRENLTNFTAEMDAARWPFGLGIPLQESYTATAERAARRYGISNPLGGPGPSFAAPPQGPPPGLVVVPNPPPLNVARPPPPPPPPVAQQVMTVGVPAPLNPGSQTRPGPITDSTVVTLRWQPVPGASHYDLGVRDVISGELAEDRRVGETSYTAALQPGRQYRWNVASCTAAGCSTDFSTPLYFMTPAPPPLATAPPPAVIPPAPPPFVPLIKFKEPVYKSIRTDGA